MPGITPGGTKGLTTPTVSVIAMVININPPGGTEPFTGRQWADADLPVIIRLPDAVIAAGPDACEAGYFAVRMAEYCVRDDLVWVIELNDRGELEFTPMPGPPNDLRNGALSFAIYQWDKARGDKGLLTGPRKSNYRLPNGAIRRPNVAWTAIENQLLPVSDYLKARPHCPDLVVEMRCEPRQLPSMLAKMKEYMDNGAKLGWLLDIRERTVRIYRAGVAEPELLVDPEFLYGENILPGFSFAVRERLFDLTYHG